MSHPLDAADDRPVAELLEIFGPGIEATEHPASRQAKQERSPRSPGLQKTGRAIQNNTGDRSFAESLLGALVRSHGDPKNDVFVCADSGSHCLHE